MNAIQWIEKNGGRCFWTTKTGSGPIDHQNTVSCWMVKGNPWIMVEYPNGDTSLFQWVSDPSTIQLRKVTK